jgi:hypothetical protein
MATFHVKIVGGQKSDMMVREHNIPAASEEEAWAWGVKQARSLKLSNPVVVVKENVDEKSAGSADATVPA